MIAALAEAREVSMRYCRPMDLPALPELQNIELHDPQYPDTLHDLAHDQLRTATIRLALYVARKRLAPLNPITMIIDACLVEETKIRDGQTAHEILLWNEGVRQ